jgi:hypothetical protein
VLLVTLEDSVGWVGAEATNVGEATLVGLESTITRIVANAGLLWGYSNALGEVSLHQEV